MNDTPPTLDLTLDEAKEVLACVRYFLDVSTCNDPRDAAEVMGPLHAKIAAYVEQIKSAHNYSDEPAVKP